MVKNPKQKGQRSVKKAIEYYTDQGWLIEKVEKTGKFVFEKDLYTLFDAVGIKPNKVVFLQVKTNRPPPRKDFLDFAGSYAGENVRVESYTWYDFKGPKIMEYLSNGEIITHDLRKK